MPAPNGERPEGAGGRMTAEREREIRDRNVDAEFRLRSHGAAPYSVSLYVADLCLVLTELDATRRERDEWEQIARGHFADLQAARDDAERLTRERAEYEELYYANNAALGAIIEERDEATRSLADARAALREAGEVTDEKVERGARAMKLEEVEMMSDEELNGGSYYHVLARRALTAALGGGARGTEGR